MTSSRTIGRRHVIAGLAALAAPAPAILHAAPPAPALTPEDFGAHADGRDDSDAFRKLLAAQQKLGGTISLAKDAVYGLGFDGWAGVGVALVRDCVIEGNGARLVLLADPGQSDELGATRPFLKFDGGATGHRVAITNLAIDLGGRQAAGLFLIGCTAEITLCSVVNGGKGELSSYGIFANRSKGTLRGNTIRNCVYAIFCGASRAGYGCDGLDIVHNDIGDCHPAGRPEQIGDGVAGILRNALIAENIIRGCFSGVMLGAFEPGNERSADVRIVRNRISDFHAHGIQIGDTQDRFRNRHITIQGNQIRHGIGGGAALYLLFADDVTTSSNVAEDVETGISISGAARVSITGDRLGGKANKRGSGVRIDDEMGLSTDVSVSDVTAQGFYQSRYVASKGSVRFRGGNLSNN